MGPSGRPWRGNSATFSGGFLRHQLCGAPHGFWQRTANGLMSKSDEKSYGDPSYAFKRKSRSRRGHDEASRCSFRVRKIACESSVLLMTSLLLLQQGYVYVPYCSLDSIIERNNNNYELSLRKARQILDVDDSGLDGWLVFFLSVKRQFREQLPHLQISSKSQEQT